MSERQEIVPGVWLGSQFSAVDTDALHRDGITHVVTAMTNADRIVEVLRGQGLVVLHLPIEDDPAFDITVFLPSAIQFIESAHGGVLVHCSAGVSRSATLVAAYLMKTRGWTPDRALILLRHVRPLVRPNRGFMDQLEIVHQSLRRGVAPLGTQAAEEVSETSATTSTLR